jgi:Porin subfamily
MKMVKSLILGSAAGLIAMSGAQAADLPVKAKAVEYVRICSLYGAGFYYMPGTDTCIKFGGYVRADTILGSNNDYGFAGGATGARNRLSNNYTTRARTDFTIDTRTATEYGVLRTFSDLVFSWNGGGYTALGTGATSYDAVGTNVGSYSLGMYHAFIQFAGFTFGRTVSAFDAPWQSYPAGGPDTLPGGSNHVTGVNQITYTAQFGNGVSGSISAQDANQQTYSNLYNLGFAPAFAPPVAAFLPVVTGGYGANDIGGTRAPDIVGNITVDQAWGLFKFSAAGHNNHAAYYAATEPSGHPDDKWGWAVQAALSIKNIPTGPGDVINVQAVYTDGASKYNFQNLFPQAFAIYGGTGLPGAYQSIGLGVVADGAFSPGTGIETVKTWGFRGGYTHNWSPTWATAIYGAYAQLKYGNATKTTLCGVAGNGVGGTLGVAVAAGGPGFVGTACSPDFNIGVIGGNIVWTPVKGFAFTVDANWTRLDQKYAGTFAAGNAGVAKPVALYEAKDQNMYNMLIRAQRNF